LHDNVNQLLGASKLYLDMAKTGEANSEMYLSRSSEYTFMAIEEIRKLSKVLTTDILSKLGLCEAIENISRDMMEVNPVIIVCALDNRIENSVNNKFKLNIFRIVQEQLNNIVKHANAKNVVITLLQNKKAIILSVSDNGVGFDTNQKRKGIGVANIRSRAISYNGIADFVSKPGHGCVLTVTFSMAKALLAESPQFEAVDDKKSRLVEKIKKVVVELIYSSDEQLKINFSYYLSKKLQYDYTYLANLFSEVEGTTIEKLFISHKIERAKSLLLDDELNLTKIALKLHYSSVAHLSNQFKKVTGLTPTLFKQMNRA
jgi:two-component sensor histidine kinase